MKLFGTIIWVFTVFGAISLGTPDPQVWFDAPKGYRQGGIATSPQPLQEAPLVTITRTTTSDPKTDQLAEDIVKRGLFNGPTFRKGLNFVYLCSQILMWTQETK